MKNEIKEIEKDLEFVKNIYVKLLTILPSFDITDSKILPYGLKAHTRSVSWLIEQVITQQNIMPENLVLMRLILIFQIHLCMIAK